MFTCVVKQLSKVTPDEVAIIKDLNFGNDGYMYSFLACANLVPSKNKRRDKEVRPDVKNNFVLLGYLDDKLVGWAITIPTQNQAMFFVNPSFRNRGVGRRLHHRARSLIGVNFTYKKGSKKNDPEHYYPVR